MLLYWRSCFFRLRPLFRSFQRLRISEPKTEKGYISLGMSKRISFFELTNERWVREKFTTNEDRISQDILSDIFLDIPSDMYPFSVFGSNRWDLPSILHKYSLSGEVILDRSTNFLVDCWSNFSSVKGSRILNLSLRYSTFIQFIIYQNFDIPLLASFPLIHCSYVFFSGERMLERSTNLAC